MKEHAKNQWYRVGSLTRFFDFFGTSVKGQKVYDFPKFPAKGHNQFFDFGEPIALGVRICLALTLQF